MENKIKNCCLFDKPETEFKENKDFVIVKKYGEIPSPNECKRSLFKCNKCGAMFLYQFLEWNDCYYDDYIQVESEEQADKLNEELSYSNFGTSSNPMIKIGSDKKVNFKLPHSRVKQIVDAVFNKDHDKLDELNLSDEEVKSLLNAIDKKIEKLDLEMQEYINDAENK